MDYFFIVATLVVIACALYWPRPFVASGEIRKQMTQKDFDEMVEKILSCPSTMKGLVFSEVKHVRPSLKLEIEDVLKQYLDVV